MLFSNKKVIGLDVGTTSLKWAEVDVSRRGAVLKNFSMMQSPQGAINGGEVVDPIALSDAVRMLAAEVNSKRKKVASGMWGTSVIVKKISIPAMDPDLVGEQIRWEAEQYIPFDISEVNLEYHLLQNQARNPETMDVLLVAAQKDLIFKLVEVIEAASLQTSIIDVNGFALANCFQANYGRLRSEVIGLLNFGADVTNFVVVDSGEVVFSRDLPVGGATYTNDIHKQMGVSFEEAESLKLSAAHGQQVPEDVLNIMKNTTEMVAEEVNGGFDFYTATASGAEISRAFVSGGCLGVPSMLQAVSNAVNVPFEYFDAFQRVGYDHKKFSPEYLDNIRPFAPIALGLALRKEGDS